MLNWSVQYGQTTLSSSKRSETPPVQFVQIMMQYYFKGTLVTQKTDDTAKKYLSNVKSLYKVKPQ